MAATLKALLLPFGPILSLVAGFRVVTLPLIRRAVDRGAAAGGDTDGWTLRLVAIGAVATAAVSVAVAGVTRALPAGWVGPSLDAVRPLLWWGAALTVMFVVAQLLADVRALSRPPRIVIARRAAAIGLEWMGLLAGTALAGTHGLAVGWTIGLALATMAWLAPMTPDPTVSVRAATAP
jgi:hypothetical protein